MSRLSFPESFFEEEERWDFKVNEMMKHAWAAQLQVLWDVMEICKRHSIGWFIYWGSLIGTVRHKGFIPWDDDLDIAMKGEDYVRFLRYAAEELPHDMYKINNTYTSDDWDNYFTRIVSSEGVDFTEEGLERWHGCPFGMGLDVFPLYSLPSDPEEARVQEELLKSVAECATYAKLVEAEAPGTEKYDNMLIVLTQRLVEIENATGYEFNSERRIFSQLQIVYDQICRIYTPEESEYFVPFPLYIERGLRFKKEYLENMIDMPFEHIIVKAPARYDDILRTVFGDYMTPVKFSGAHEYPFFKNSILLLGKHLEKEYLLEIRNDKGREEKEERVKEWLGRNKDKKKLLYYTTVSGYMMHSERVTEKLAEVFKLLEDNEDVALWWFPCGMTSEEKHLFNIMFPAFYKRYRDFFKECGEVSDRGILLDESGDYQRAIEMSDCLYGDEGLLTDSYKETGKPIMIQDYNIVIS
ncbi:MAG: LicD family protein [Lachnospiraceae bacterium]|nr:LicD family protein [Lachnospiraceae bacterium]